MNPITSIKFSSLEDVRKVCGDINEWGASIGVAGYSGTMKSEEFYKLISDFVLNESNMRKGDKKTYDDIMACLKSMKKADPKCDQTSMRVPEIETIFQHRVFSLSRL